MILIWKDFYILFTFGKVVLMFILRKVLSQKFLEEKDGECGIKY